MHHWDYMHALPGFYGKLIWLLGLKMCVTTSWSVRLTSGAALLSDLQASFIYQNADEMPPHLCPATVVVAQSKDLGME